jgi:phosphopantothenoylcysteine synthetase/decarboxylase
MLAATVDKYLAMRRAMGFKFKVPARLLKNFAKFAKTQGEKHVKSNTVIKWAGLSVSIAQKRNRLLTVRRFAIAMKSPVNKSEIPSSEAFGRHQSDRRIPHIHIPREIQLLLTAPSSLSPADTIKPKHIPTCLHC